MLKSQKGVLLNQRKYALELVSDVGLSGAKTVSTPLETNIKLTTAEYDKLIGYTDDPQLEYISSYKKLVGKYHKARYLLHSPCSWPKHATTKEVSLGCCIKSDQVY